MDVEPDAVSGAVNEVSTPAGVVDDAASGGVDLVGGHPGPDGVDGGGLSALQDGVRLERLLWGSTEGVGPGAVGEVAVLVGTAHVDQDEVASFEAT